MFSFDLTCSYIHIVPAYNYAFSQRSEHRVAKSAASLVQFLVECLAQGHVVKDGGPWTGHIRCNTSHLLVVRSRLEYTLLLAQGMEPTTLRSLVCLQFRLYLQADLTSMLHRFLLSVLIHKALKCTCLRSLVRSHDQINIPNLNKQTGVGTSSVL